MARCGCGTGACDCTILSGLPDCITVSGNGSVRLPYTIGLTLDPLPTNVLECGPNGLLVDSANIPVAVLSQNGVQGDGTLGNELDVFYSADADNQAAAGTDGGVFVPFPTINVALPITGDGTVGNPLGLLISADVGNSATTGADGGVFVPSGGAATVNTNLPIQGDGSGGSPVDLLVSTDAGNIVALGTDSGVFATVATTNCVTGDGTGASPIDLTFNAASSVQCGGSGIELDLDGTNGGTSGLSDSAAGLRVAESPRGALKRSGSGLSQLAWHSQFAWSANLTTTGFGNTTWRFQTNGVAPNPVINTIPAAFGSWNNASGQFDFLLAGMWLVSLSMLLPPSGITDLRGWNMYARRGGVTVAEGVGGTGLLNSPPAAHTLFSAEMRRVGYTFVMSYNGGQSMKPFWEFHRNAGLSGTSQTISATASLTYLGELQ